MRYHTQNLTDGRLPIWRYGRGWFGPLHVEWNAFRDIGLLQVALRRSGFSLYLKWFSLYVNVGEARGGQWAVRWIDDFLSLSHPWVRQNEWRSADPWWRKDVNLHVVDWLIGRCRVERVDGETRDVFIPMPEGSYRATAQHQTYVRRRRWYWPVDRRESVWLDIPDGIPHAGKGENGWDCGDDGLLGCGGDTEEKAIAHAVESVLRSRRRYGRDSADTGRSPLIVLNPATPRGSRD